MRAGALVLGILGGLAGMGGALIALGFGGLGAALGAEEAGTVIGASVVAILLSILGMIGGALALSKPKAAGILMLIAGIGGFIAISFAYTVGTILLTAGGISALVLRKEK